MREVITRFGTARLKTSVGCRSVEGSRKNGRVIKRYRQSAKAPKRARAREHLRAKDSTRWDVAEVNQPFC